MCNFCLLCWSEMGSGLLMFYDEQHLSFNTIALRMTKTPQSFGHFECNRVKS